MPSLYIYALVSSAAYPDPKNSAKNTLAKEGWTCIVDDPARDTWGYHGVAYTKGNEIIIGHRGTYLGAPIPLALNLLSDLQIAFQSRPGCHQAARAFSQFVRNNAPFHHFFETGHSLGGAYAALNACFFGGASVSIDSPSIGSLLTGLNTNDVQYNPVRTHLVTVFSNPNFINHTGTPIGECYFIILPSSSSSWIPGYHALVSHSISNIIANGFVNGNANVHLIANENWSSLYSMRTGCPKPSALSNFLRV